MPRTVLADLSQDETLDQDALQRVRGGGHFPHGSPPLPPAILPPPELAWLELSESRYETQPAPLHVDNKKGWRIQLVNQGGD